MAGTAAPPESPPRSSAMSPACRDERLRRYKGVEHRVHDRWRRADRAALADALHAQGAVGDGVAWRWTGSAAARRRAGWRIEERAGQELARFAVIVHTLV